MFRLFSAVICNCSSIVYKVYEIEEGFEECGREQLVLTCLTKNTCQIKCPFNFTMHLSLRDWHTNVTARQISNVVVTTAVIHNFIFSVYHFIKILQCISKRKLSHMHKISLITLSVIFLYNLECVRHLYFLNPPVSWWSCTINIRICFISWVLSKIAGYSFFLERLFIVFRGTKLRFSKHQISIAKTILLIDAILYISIIIFFVQGMIRLYIFFATQVMTVPIYTSISKVDDIQS